MAEGMTAVQQLVARFVFDPSKTAEAQQSLASCIEEALADFKATKMDGIIRGALVRCVNEAVTNWYRGYYAPRPLRAAEPIPETPPSRPPRTRAKRRKGSDAENQTNAQ